MRTAIRAGAAAFFAAAVGWYLWHGLTYRSDALTGDVFGWVGWQLALPIAAVSVLPVAFVLTSGLVTGGNSPRFRDGQLGIGTVESFAQTGLYINDQPQLRIELQVEGAGGEVFRSHAKMIVPLAELALLRPGVVLPVRYLPDRTDRVEIDRSGDRSAVQRAVNETMIRKGLTTRAALDVAERGVAAQAVVQTLSVPGETREDSTAVDLGLLITRPDGSTFTAAVRKFVPQRNIGQVQVGRIVQVRYLAADEREVVLALPVNT
ncbi:hypothetical protein [Nocardia aurantia]|uniref:Uncharacterized protein n=1 Tax=Nocardia aurantia TaxID=2585199 RepID=A0A7K0DNJ8_9NOCA|nr:hypothetical protein [Nocardia aurantia]MQY27188.1 hypothetical protein [Nocardia aurantia]